MDFRVICHVSRTLLNLRRGEPICSPSSVCSAWPSVLLQRPAQTTCFRADTLVCPYDVTPCGNSPGRHIGLPLRFRGNGSSHFGTQTLPLSMIWSTSHPRLCSSRAIHFLWHFQGNRSAHMMTEMLSIAIDSRRSIPLLNVSVMI
jgi:hypothetical protein